MSAVLFEIAGTEDADNVVIPLTKQNMRRKLPQQRLHPTYRGVKTSILHYIRLEQNI